VLFCQREAAETAIFLAEVAGRHGTADYRRRLEPEDPLHNDGLPRVALKMATGTGKTVVISMIIAWQATWCRWALRSGWYDQRRLWCRRLDAPGYAGQCGHQAAARGW
jgi:hypothetical protein